MDRILARQIGLYTSIQNFGFDIPGRSCDADSYGGVLANFILENADSFVERRYQEIDNAIANGLLLSIRIGCYGKCRTSGDISSDRYSTALFVEFADVEKLAAETVFCDVSSSGALN